MLKHLFSVVLAMLVFSAQAAEQTCPLTDTRICAVAERLEQYGQGFIVYYEESDSNRYWAQHQWLGVRDQIQLGDTLLLTDDELVFVLAHEYAHAYLRHGRKLLDALVPAQARALPDATLYQVYANRATREAIDTLTPLNHGQEFEADAFAFRVLLTEGRNPVEAMRHVLYPKDATPTHPGSQDRLARAQQAQQAWVPSVATR